MKISKKLLIAVVVITAINCVCFIMQQFGKVSVISNGIAVDSADALYVGKQKEIEKYVDGVLVDTINPMTTRTYMFTIQPDDTLLLSTSSTVYVMTLNGDIISQYEDENTEIYNKLQKSKNRFVNKDGTVYTKTTYWGRDVITVNNDTIIYKMPVLDYILRLLSFFSFISYFVVVPMIILQCRKAEKGLKKQRRQIQ